MESLCFVLACSEAGRHGSYNSHERHGEQRIADRLDRTCQELSHGLHLRRSVRAPAAAGTLLPLSRRLGPHVRKGTCWTMRYFKVKLAHTRLPSVGFRSWSRFLAVSLQVTWVINPAVSCHYFPLGPQLPSRPLKRGLLSISRLGEQRHDGCEQFA